MSKLEVMVAHYIIMGGVMTKLSEVCVANGGGDCVKEINDCFADRISKDVKQLKENPDNVDVTVMDITDRITYVTFSGLNGMHVLEYYITLVSD